MMYYARSDTHYLLFIYDNLRNALLDLSQSRAQSRAHSPASNPDAQTNRSRGSTPDEDPKTLYVREVLSRSERTALRVCQHESYDAEGMGPGGWDSLARKWNKGALIASESNAHGRIYRRLHAWRDHIAREEDESTGYRIFHENLESSLMNASLLDTCCPTGLCLCSLSSLLLM